MLSNFDLIQVFVQHSYRNQEVLLANSELRAESMCGSNQLFAKKEGLVLTTQKLSQKLQFLAKSGSAYWNEITKALVETGFFIAGNANQRNFYTFQFQKIPAGYQVHCAESIMLWRLWWKYRERIISTTLPTDLFIRTRDTWYPIRNLCISDGILYVQTFGSEIQLHASDLVIWLTKCEVDPSKTTPSQDPSKITPSQDPSKITPSQMSKLNHEKRR